MSAEDSMNFKGFIKSKTDIGFTLDECMNEKIENSDSANAKTIKITLFDGHKMAIADDADGMNDEGLKRVGCLHDMSSSSAFKHGTKGVGGNIADINFSGIGPVEYCSKPASSPDRLYYMRLNYDARTEEEYRPRPQEAPARIERDIWNKFAIDKTHSGTIQVFETVPRNIYAELCESIKSTDIARSYRRIWGLTYNSFLRDANRKPKLIFDVEGEIVTIHPIDMTRYDKTAENDRHIDRCSIYTRNGEEETRVYYTNEDGELNYRDFSSSTKGKQENSPPPEDGFTKVGEFSITHTYNKTAKWRELDAEELLQNGIDVSNGLSDQALMNHTGGGGITIARNRKHVATFSISKPGDSNSITPYQLNSKHLLDYDASDDMDNRFKIQLNKSKLVWDKIQKEVRLTIQYLNKQFVNKMMKIHPKDVPAVPVPAPAPAPAPAPPAVVDMSSTTSSSPSSSASSVSSTDESGGEDDGHDTGSSSLPHFPPPRVSVIPTHVRVTIPQNHGIQILQTLKQQPQYHELMADTVDTLLVDCCRRILDERNGRLMTKRLINIGSFENKCDLLYELLQGIYVLPEDTMRHGAELYRKYNAVVNGT